MDDVSVELIEKIQKQFVSEYKANDQIKAYLKRLYEGKATYREANNYAIKVGDLLSDAYQANVTADMLPNQRMYYNIANKVLTNTLGKDGFDLVSSFAMKTQKVLNKKAGIGLNAVAPKLNEDRISGLASKIGSYASFEDAKWLLGEPITNFTQSIVDDTIKANVDFHAKNGMRPIIRRIGIGNPCKWCQALIGTYEYEDAPRDVFRRHRDCRCNILYDPLDGSRRMWDVHRKIYKTNTKSSKEMPYKLNNQLFGDKKKHHKKVLSGREENYVRHELNTWLDHNHLKKGQPVNKAIGDYLYSFEYNGFDDYYFYGKTKIK